MAKKKTQAKLFTRIAPRTLKSSDRKLFLRAPRRLHCHYDPTLSPNVSKLNHQALRQNLSKCPTIEHQFIVLREQTQLNVNELKQRYNFTKSFLTCLRSHHRVIYEGILFGSTINGLGFHDSDVDLRLRPLKLIENGIYEPISLDMDMVERTLRDIAYQTTRCCPAIGEFVPSTRCPIAKMKFMKLVKGDKGGKDDTLSEGLKYDVSLSSTNSLGTFNSMILRFLCRIEPKFHLLANFLRYWSNVHGLIVSGFLSSYALINMLIFFCQTIQPPLLPTMDYMRDQYFKDSSDDLHKKSSRKKSNTCKKAVLQVEWNCLLCLKESSYKRSLNSEPLGVLLLKFFEFYLNFPYSTHIITARPGRALDHEEFKKSPQYNPRFKTQPFLNIQDPFDMKHNLTLGMKGAHFRLLIETIRFSYEKLYNELLRFNSPISKVKDLKDVSKDSNQANHEVWGLNSLLIKSANK